MNSRWMTALAAAALAIGGAGCGEKLLGISATISVTPTALAFGQGAVNVPQSITVSVTNLGSAALVITGLKVATDPNRELSLGNQLTNACDGSPRSGSTTLSPGECASFTVTWSPTAAHAAEGSVEVDSSDATTPVITLPVTGNAASALLQYCVLDSTGDVDPSQCSDLSANPPVLPTVDFGTGLPSEVSTRKVRITNQGMEALTLLPAPVIDASLAQASVFTVSGSAPGGSLAPGASADYTLTATPTANGTINGALDVASNDLRAPVVAIPLQIFVAGWQLCVDPTTGLDFGTVTIGQSATQTITFTNCGSADFTIDQFTFAGYAPTTHQFTITTGSLPAAMTAFPVGAKIQLGVTYTPTAVQSDKASFDYQLAVGGDALMDSVYAVGKGAAGACGSSGSSNPVPNIVTSYATSQNGSYSIFLPAATPSPVIPLDWIKLNGSTSTTASGAAPSSYLWQLVSQPAGSTTTLSGATTVQASLQALVSGDYTLSLTIKDPAACTATKTVTIHVVPQGDVHIELTWPESCGDVDLHYVRPNHNACSPDDCFYANKQTSWGANLDRDDQWGNGPENITQAAPADGTPYEIWVYYYSASPDGGGGSGTCGTTHPTVNVYFQGMLSATYTLTQGFGEYQLWHAADVTVSNSASQFSVAAVTTGSGSPGNLGQSCE